MMSHKTSKRFLSKGSLDRATYGKKRSRNSKKYPCSLTSDPEPPGVIYIPPKKKTEEVKAWVSEWEAKQSQKYWRTVSRISPPRITRVSEDEAAVKEVYPDAYVRIERSQRTVVRPRTADDPAALVPYVLIGNNEYTFEAAWKSAHKLLLIKE